MYSRLLATVNVAAALLAAPAVPARPPAGDRLVCDPALSARFAPRRPLLGRYEVCTTARTIRDAAPRGAAIDAIDPLDAFGIAGRYDRAALARLYSGRRALVAHAWRQTAEAFESLTFISPYPDSALQKLEPDTMIIRFVVMLRAPPAPRGL